MFLAPTPSFVGSSTASVDTSTPAAAVDVTVGRAVAHTGPNFVCWNLDASRNREFFDRNLSTALPLGARAAVFRVELNEAFNRMNCSRSSSRIRT